MTMGTLHCLTPYMRSVKLYPALGIAIPVDKNTRYRCVLIGLDNSKDGSTDKSVVSPMSLVVSFAPVIDIMA